MAKISCAFRNLLHGDECVCCMFDIFQVNKNAKPKLFLKVDIMSTVVIMEVALLTSASTASLKRLDCLSSMNSFLQMKHKIMVPQKL